MKRIKDIIMDQYNISEAEADDKIEEARDDLLIRIENDDPSAYDLCNEYFGLEPDYLEQLL